MRNRLFIITIYFFLSFYTNPQTIYAFPQKDDYLWVEFGKQIKERNGSVSQPLFIYYGRFPDKKEGILELEDLRGFYTLNEKDEEGENIFYTTAIERDKKASFIKINSLQTNCFTVLVVGKRNSGGVRYEYLAKADFILFGHSSVKKKEVKPFVPSKEITRRMEICITPEYYCWRQIGDSVKLTPLFDKGPLGGQEIHLADETGNYMVIETDKLGNYIYIPPDDQKLRLKGETAYKQTIILAEKTVENRTHKSSYTLLVHRSRFGNMNLHLGGSILGGTMAMVFIVVVVKRKNFQL